MALALTYITEGPRIFFTSWKNRILPKRYPGTAEDICRQIVVDCWNGRFFQTSTTNFPQFWTRDFGWCTQSLLKIGYDKEVQQTLRYAINRFKQARKVTATITPRGKPFDFPTYAVDSLPWLIHSMKLAKFPYYDHKDFLNKEIKKFFYLVVDKKTGLVQKQKHFSSMKDFSIRNSSCYDNTMIALLAKHLATMKLFNPFKPYDYPKLLTEYFWNGSYFYDDLNKKNYVAADANLFPFILGIINNKEMMTSAMESIREVKLDIPFPLKYTAARAPVSFIPQEFLMYNYESNAIWMHMGPLYIKLMQKFDPSYGERLKQHLTSLIEHHQNFLEVFDPDGRPYSNPFYYCSSGMLWAANYLNL